MSVTFINIPKSWSWIQHDFGNTGEEHSGKSYHKDRLGWGQIGEGINVGLRVMGLFYRHSGVTEEF